MLWAHSHSAPKGQTLGQERQETAFKTAARPPPGSASLHLLLGQLDAARASCAARRPRSPPAPGEGGAQGPAPEAASPRFCAFVNLCLTMSSPHPREPLRPAGGGMSFRGLAELQGSGLLLPQMLQKQDQRLWKELFKRFSGRPAFPFSGSPVPSILFQDLCAPWPPEPALPRPGARSAAAAGGGDSQVHPPVAPPSSAPPPRALTLNLAPEARVAPGPPPGPAGQRSGRSGRPRRRGAAAGAAVLCVSHAALEKVSVNILCKRTYFHLHL